MDTSVGNKFFKCYTRNLASDGVKGGERNGFRCVVNNEIDSGDGLESSDVASLAADDSALHFIVGQRNNGNSRLRRMVCGAALNGRCDNLLRKRVALVTNLLLVFHDLDRFFSCEGFLQRLE